MYTAKISKLTENPVTGMANAEVEVWLDSNTEAALGILTVTDKIEDIHERIKTDLKQFLDGFRAELVVKPKQEVFKIDSDGNIT